MGAFSGKNGRARKTRFTLSDTYVITADDGKVGRGVDNGTAEDYFLHTDIPGRSGAEAVALHAVAKGIGGGVISAAEVIECYDEEGNLDKLRRALAAWDAKHAPPAPRRRKAKAPAKVAPAAATAAE